MFLQNLERPYLGTEQKLSLKWLVLGYKLLTGPTHSPCRSVFNREVVKVRRTSTASAKLLHSELGIGA